MPSEVELLETENIGSIFAIISYLILISSASMSIKIELMPQKAASTKISPTPSQVTVSGSLVYVLSTLILFLVALERIKQRNTQLQAGTASGTLLPNLWIGAGTALSFAGALALIRGSQLRVLEEGQVTII